MLALMVFLAAAVLAFGLMAAAHARSSVKRRAAGIAEYRGERDAGDKNSLRSSSLKAVQRLLDYTTKHYSTERQRRRQGPAPPADPGRHLRSPARSPSSSSRAPCWRSAWRSARSSSCRCWSRRSRDLLAVGDGAAASSAISARACTSTGGSPGTRTSIAPAFRISWISWWCARIPA